MTRSIAFGFVTLFASFLFASAASAVLVISSPQDTPAPVDILAAPGEVVTIDFTLSTTGPEALALGLRAANYDPTILTNGTATIVPDAIFGTPFNGQIIGGLTNSASGQEEAPGGVRPGWSINLFQGISITPSVTSGPEAFQIQFVMGAPGITTVDIGALLSYADIYVGDTSAHPMISIVIATPEPGTAVLLGLGLIGLGANRRREEG
ncbi:MAG: PEP-CTERM sorting domain-containing protein [Myxococcota bacterium]